MRVFPIVLVVVSISALAQGQSYLLKPYQAVPGQTVVARASSDASGGQITVMSHGVVRKGEVSIKRQRTFERRVIGSGATAKLEYVMLVDQTHSKTVMGENSDTSAKAGALMGKVAYGLRDDMNRWRLFLKGGTASSAQATDLVELESYENRRWFQQVPVKVGQTWNIEPSFIRNFIERDMGSALVSATMTFKSVELMGGERTAVLNFSIQTQAVKDKAGKVRVSSVVADFHRTLYLSLATMLDKKLTMSGTLTTSTSKGGVTTVVKSPVTYIIVKSIR